MQEQTSLQVADLAAAVGLDDRPLHLTRPVDEEDHRLGPLDASAQLVEYGDYQCPFCAQALPGVKTILSRYGDRVLFVFRHFPLVSQHSRAWHAALAAEAAGAQGRFWQMHDHLLGNQHELSDEELTTHARALGPPLTAGASAVDSVAFGRDGQTLAVGSYDGTVRLWNLDVGYAIERICTTAGGLTPQQWHKYIPQLPYQPTCEP